MNTLIKFMLFLILVLARALRVNAESAFTEAKKVHRELLGTQKLYDAMWLAIDEERYADARALAERLSPSEDVTRAGALIRFLDPEVQEAKGLLDRMSLIG